MESYVVLRYEMVLIRILGDREPRNSPGPVLSAQVVTADREEAAIKAVADGEEGYYAALPVPSNLTRYSAELVFNAR